MEDILALIKDYQESVQYGVRHMQSEFETKELLKAWISKKIPKEGVLSSGIEYDFHGVGCLLTINHVEVDFDFGPDDRYDGFDLWRLGLFIDEKPNTYKRYVNNSKLLEEDFQALIDNGLIYHPKWFPGSSLWYFVEKQT